MRRNRNLEHTLALAALPPARHVAQSAARNPRRSRNFRHRPRPGLRLRTRSVASAAGRPDGRRRLTVCGCVERGVTERALGTDRLCESFRDLSESHRRRDALAGCGGPCGQPGLSPSVQELVACWGR
ncbi:hypothetical protein PAL_GLEAN10013289 [Pteropus alecto]|uniref:Uncharacterized protein n=1 Tax=Pteropus alecto TaxID=9402 RepID=L5KEJ9_PTEAL|nr:hypothetical protein PAL_GLEAN10013289 [Pteropus alecto]